MHGSAGPRVGEKPHLAVFEAYVAELEVQLELQRFLEGAKAPERCPLSVRAGFVGQDWVSIAA